MRLDDFPECSEKASIWPWGGVVTSSLATSMPNGKPWPKITIVTPSYNQGEYIEETIRSVLLQGYPNLEYMIIDGGSSDQTVKVIKKYEDKIDYWVSESDSGQSHAINKGFQRASGDLIAWINSDDLLLPGALHDVALLYKPSSNAIILGDVINFMDGRNQETLIQQWNITLKSFVGAHNGGFSWHQPGTFVSKECLKNGGKLDESLHFSFDWDWMCKMLTYSPVIYYLKKPVARFRIHDESKTGGDMPACWKETMMVIQRYNDTQTKREKHAVLSFYHLNTAGLYFSNQPNTDKYWNRLKGVQSLFKAIVYSFSVIKRKEFRQLVVRALLPKFLYRSR